jgi:hypothetical protein
MSSFQ